MVLIRIIMRELTRGKQRLLWEVKECIRKHLFTEFPLKKAFFSYGSGIPKRTLSKKNLFYCITLKPKRKEKWRIKSL